MPDTASPPLTAAQVDRIRSFNRFFTQHVGVVRERMLGTAFTLLEARVVFELAKGADLTAADLCRALDVDAGAMSRVLSRLEDEGHVRRRASREDGRKRLLRLTGQGRRAHALIDRRAAEEVQAMHASLDTTALGELLGAMETIERIYDATTPPVRAYLIRAPRQGDYGWLIHRQSLAYQQEYGWNEEYEGLVAKILGEFLLDHDPERERGWVVEQDGHAVGCVFLVRESKRVARLRLLYVEPQARGMGIGTELARLCIRFARETGYRRMVLWTNSVLDAARRIYERVGFELTEEASHSSFGKDLVGQTWTLEL